MKMNPRPKPKIWSRLFWLVPLFVWFAVSPALLQTTFAYDRNQTDCGYDGESAGMALCYDQLAVLTKGEGGGCVVGQLSSAVVLGQFLAAKTTAPRFLVTESGVAVPTSAAELKANMQLLQEASTKPATARKFLGTDSQGPLRVRIEQAHPSTPGYTGPIDPLHTVDHLHIDRRLNGTTGPWQSSEKLPYDWPF